MAKLNIAPTKSNLLAMKEQLAVSTNGYDLLEEKREILVRELMHLVEKVKLLEKEIDEVVAQAYPAFKKMLMLDGADQIERISHGIHYDFDISEKKEHPKVSSELISSTYLPCIMQGLSIAPEIKSYNQGEIKNKDIEYLIVPYDAMGSSAVLSCIENNVKIITIENKTVLNVTSDKLKIKPYKHFSDYISCLKTIK